MIASMPRRLASFGMLLAFVVAPATRAASSGPVFGLRAAGNPRLGYFVYNPAPGAARNGAIIVSNTGDRTGTVKLYPVDATTGRTTGTVYLTNRKRSGFGTWVQLASSSLTLAPGQHVTVPFTLRVPASAKPGQWVAGIVAEPTHTAQGAKTSSTSNVRIRIRNLTIIAVETNVPGPAVVSFRIGPVTTGGQRGFQEVLVGFTNAGNQLRKPRDTVTIRDAQNKIVETLTSAMDTFLPQTSITYPLLLKRALRPGDYRADIQLVTTDASGAAQETVKATRSFSVSKHDVTQVFTSSNPTQPPTGAGGGTSASPPWAWIAAAATGVLLLALLVFQLVRRFRRSAT
jgi:hypothetical protein